MLQKITVATLFLVALAWPCQEQNLLAGWDTNGFNTAVATLTTSTSDSRLSASPLSKGNGINTPTTYPENTFSASGWPTSSSNRSNTDYFQVNLSYG